MTKIKSVEYIARKNAPFFIAYEGAQEACDQLEFILTNDRQAFEEAILEALQIQKTHYAERASMFGIDAVELASALEARTALDQAIATIRSIYQDNK